MEDVAGGIQDPQTGEAPAEFEEDPAHAAEEPCALEAEVLPLSNPGARLAEHPAKNQAAKRSTRQPLPRPALRGGAGLGDAPRGSLPVGRCDPVGQVADRSQKRKRVVVQREALERVYVRLSDTSCHDA